MRREIRELITNAKWREKNPNAAGIKCGRLAELWPVVIQSCTVRKRGVAQDRAGFYDRQIWFSAGLDNVPRYLSVPNGIRRSAEWKLVAWRPRAGKSWRMVPWYEMGGSIPLLSPRAVITASSQPESPAELG